MSLLAIIPGGELAAGAGELAQGAEETATVAREGMAIAESADEVATTGEKVASAVDETEQTVSEGGQVASDSEQAAQEGSQIDKQALQEAEEKYPNKVGKVEDHHITPKYLGGAADGPTSQIPAAYHQAITNAFRNEWSYGQVVPSAEQLQQIMTSVYSRFPIPGWP
jgi:hypothetical protein